MSSMIQLNLTQGGEEWLDSRLRALNASEAPIIMGCHPNMTRDELLEAKATCNPKQFSDFVQKRVLDKGHEVEALARPLLEVILGEDLYPVCGKNGKLQASFDGLTLMQDTGFEHKQHNIDLAPLIAAGKPPAYIFWQLEHQLAVCPDLEKIILVCSDGTTENWVQMEYRAVPGRREQLLAAWDQFEQDLANFKPVEKTVEPVGVRPDSLPALFVEVAGALTTQSNLDAFRAGAEQLIGSIKTELVTDQDFADAEAAIKWLDETEKNIDRVISEALAKTGPLDALVRTLKDVQQNLARTTRLKLSKQVEAQKVNRRNSIVANGQRELDTFLAGVNEEFAPHGVTVGTGKVDFYTVIKGKRSFAMMVSAVNDAIAQAKIAANESAARVRKSLALLAQHAEHDFLFPNKQALVALEYDHLALTVRTKIDDYRKQQEQQEVARIQKHKNTIAGIEAAAAFDDALPYAQLVLTRQRIDKINTGDMEEFALQADNAKAATLAKIDARMKELREAEQAKQKPADPLRDSPAIAYRAPEAVRSEPPAAYAVETLPGSDDLDDSIDIHNAAERVIARAADPVKECPSADRLIATIAQQFMVPHALAEAWLCERFGNREVAA